MNFSKIHFLNPSSSKKFLIIRKFLIQKYQFWSIFQKKIWICICKTWKWMFSICKLKNTCNIVDYRNRYDYEFMIIMKIVIKEKCLTRHQFWMNCHPISDKKLSITIVAISWELFRNGFEIFVSVSFGSKIFGKKFRLKILVENFRWGWGSARFENHKSSFEMQIRNLFRPSSS